MIYRKTKKRSTRVPEGYFHIEDERTKTRVSGFGRGDSIQLKDEFGNVWSGTAVRNPDNSIVYRFRDSTGKTLSGVSDNMVVTLRDEKGRTWKGFID
jgi:hypothetical protein